MNDNLTGKQFRGMRDRHGKLIKNRLGGFEGSRRDDYNDVPRRQRLLQDAIGREERCTVDEVITGLGEKICPRTGLTIPFGGGLVIDEIDNREFGHYGDHMVIRYNADGTMMAACMVDLDDALTLSAEECLRVG